MARSEKPRKRGEFKPNAKQKAKAWVEAEASFLAHPENAAVVRAAVEKFYGPKTEVDF